MSFLLLSSLLLRTLYAMSLNCFVVFELGVINLWWQVNGCNQANVDVVNNDNLLSVVTDGH